MRPSDGCASYNLTKREATRAIRRRWPHSRCSTVATAMQEPSAISLLHCCSGTGPWDLPAAALAAAVLAHVRSDDPNNRSIARRIGPTNADQPESALVKPIRFQQRPVQSETPDERLNAFRRLVSLADGTLNIRDLAAALMQWDDTRKTHWTYDYWSTPTAPPTQEISKVNRFLQLHTLTFVPPSCLNRDDTGRPKTAMVGGAQRLRLSSQSLKRAWRTSDAFAHALTGHLGERTRRIGDVVFAYLRRDGMADAKAIEVAKNIAAVFGKVAKDPSNARTEQLAFISPEEKAAALELANKALAGEAITPTPAGLLRTADTAADIALFGGCLPTILGLIAMQRRKLRTQLARTKSSSRTISIPRWTIEHW